ncbi:MAG: hypothetical protein MJA84_10625 [Firmicutes bacterium]|nr:hypothetical protein [Bacillota bacterium]
MRFFYFDRSKTVYDAKEMQEWRLISGSLAAWFLADVSYAAAIDIGQITRESLRQFNFLYFSKVRLAIYMIKLYIKILSVGENIAK